MKKYTNFKARLIVNGNDISDEIKTCKFMLYDPTTSKILMDVNLKQVIQQDVASMLNKIQQQSNTPTGAECTNCHKYSNSISYFQDEYGWIFEICNECLAQPKIQVQSDIDREFLKSMHIKWE